MTCQNCKSNRIYEASAKCSDCCSFSIGDKEGHGYVLDVKNFGGGDYLKIKVCLDCGQAQGTFPVPAIEFEDEDEDD